MKDEAGAPRISEGILCFQSVAQAILAEQALAGRGFAVRVMPVPSRLRAGCGFCLRFLPEALKSAAAFLAERGMSAGEAYIRQTQNGADSYQKLTVNAPASGRGGLDDG